jgi:F-type H+-transporting ATPase subunit delta
MKATQRSLARRYARALLDVALAPSGAKSTSPPEALREELRSTVALLRGNPDLARVLSHPGVGAEARKKVAAAVLTRAKASPLLRRLLEMLAERRRVDLLAEIELVFSELWNAHRGVVSAEAVGAVPLGPAETKALAKALEQASGHEVELACRVDEAVLGGIVVRMGGRTYDGTVRAQLRALRESLAHGH